MWKEFDNTFDQFKAQGLALPGTLIITDTHKQLLIGDINPLGGNCDHCVDNLWVVWYRSISEKVPDYPKPIRDWKMKEALDLLEGKWQGQPIMLGVHMATVRKLIKTEQDLRKFVAYIRDPNTKIIVAPEGNEIIVRTEKMRMQKIWR